MLSAEEAAACLSTRVDRDFEAAVCRLLLTAIPDFQPVPDLDGDGGLDGISDGKTIAYCCYGPTRETLGKDSKERRKNYTRKFRHDLRRLHELDTTDRKIVHRDNLELAAILVPPPKIQLIRICVNQLRDAALIGIAEKELKTCARYSQFRFVEKSCKVVVWGPSHICGVAVHYERALVPMPSTDGKMGALPGNELAEFDAKYQYMARRSLSPNKIYQLQMRLREQWAKALAIESSLRNESPHIHADFLRIREIAEMEALEMGPTCITPEDSWAQLSKIRERLSAHLTDLLRPYGYKDLDIQSFASGEAARLVGICHVDWRQNNNFV